MSLPSLLVDVSPGLFAPGPFAAPKKGHAPSYQKNTLCVENTCHKLFMTARRCQNMRRRFSSARLLWKPDEFFPISGSLCCCTNRPYGILAKGAGCDIRNQPENKPKAWVVGAFNGKAGRA
jgi:hypothetical protein